MDSPGRSAIIPIFQVSRSPVGGDPRKSGRKILARSGTVQHRTRRLRGTQIKGAELHGRSKKYSNQHAARWDNLVAEAASIGGVQSGGILGEVMISWKFPLSPLEIPWPCSHQQMGKEIIRPDSGHPITRSLEERRSAPSPGGKSQEVDDFHVIAAQNHYGRCPTTLFQDLPSVVQLYIYIYII